MRKDFKIGLLIGLVLASAGTLWVSTRPAMNSQIIPGPTTARSAETSAGSIVSKGPTVGPHTDESSLVPRDLSNESRYVMHEPPIQSGAAPEQAEKTSGSDLGQTVPHGNAEKTQKFHIVQKDETLSAIASRYYGSANKWRTIFEANRSHLVNPDKLTPGTKLLIPD